MSDFMPEPTRVLDGIEGVRAYLAEDGPMSFTVKSPWMVTLVGEVAESEYPYNSTVQRLAEERLGIERQPDNGSRLSRLVYCAQSYRHSDALRAEGYAPFTSDVVAEAHKTGRKIELWTDHLYGGATTSVLRVKSIGGELYAMPPRSRKRHVAPYGQPARIQD